MTSIVLPTIGSSGWYQLRAPLDTLMIDGARYTCKAIRSISEYLANNEDPATDVYGLIPDEYATDLAADVQIVSLQADNGHWVYVPARYITTYPNTNGVPYRSVMIGISLPSLPADRDLSFLTSDLGDLVTDALGVIPVIKLVETSRVTLVDREVGVQLQAERTAISAGRITDRSRYMSLLMEHAAALTKIKELEQYISTHYVT